MGATSQAHAPCPTLTSVLPRVSVCRTPGLHRLSSTLCLEVNQGTSEGVLCDCQGLGSVHIMSPLPPPSCPQVGVDRARCVPLFPSLMQTSDLLKKLLLSTTSLFYNLSLLPFLLIPATKPWGESPPTSSLFVMCVSPWGALLLVRKQRRFV